MELHQHDHIHIHCVIIKLKIACTSNSVCLHFKYWYQVTGSGRIAVVSKAYLPHNKFEDSSCYALCFKPNDIKEITCSDDILGLNLEYNVWN